MKKQMLKNNRLVWFIALFIICVLSIVPAFMLKSSAAETTEGRTFTAADVDNQLYVLKHYEKLPRTIEATVNVGSQVSAASPIIGNLDTTSGCRLGLEINTSGNPVMYYYTYDNYTSVKKSSIKFSYDVRNKGEIRIAAINEIADGKSVYKLYANGELVSTVTSDPFVHNFDVAAMQREIRNLSLGCDYKNYFCGTIKNIAVYSDALTADEAYSSYKNGVDTAHADIIAYYDFTSDANTDRFIKDQTGNGHDAGDIFVPNENPVTDYAYSVAVIGDTQNLVYKDVTENTEYTTYIYDWIVANKESKNIQFVMGLGDITNYNLDDEWVLAQELLGKLEGANIPYSLIQGNHDTVAKLDQYFSTSDNFTKGTTVYYSGNSLGNYYMTFTAKNKEGAVTNNKYMIFSLEYSAKDGVIAWANDVISDNPEYSVIITTHAYLERDMSYLDVYGAPPPRRPYHTTGANNGDQIWMKLASQHENVIMVLAGHMTSNGIYKKEEIGVNGNTVFEFLIDPQGFDLSYDYKTGMVAMFYFSADGKKVATEYVSTYRSLEAQKIDKSAPDVLYNTYVSNFEFTIPENKTLSDVECEYGVIPARYSSATTYPFVVFNSDKTFVGGYFDFGDAMNAMVANDASADYNVLMRRNAEQCYASSIGALTGRINVDLGGFKLTKSQPGYLFEITVADNSSVSTEIDERASFKLSNGTVNKLAGEALVCIDYGSSSKGISKIVSATIDFEDIVFVASDADAVKWIFDTKESGYAATADGIKVLVNSTFTDCIFDYANSVDTRAALTLSCDTFDKVVYNIKINGGSIVSDTAIKLSEFAILNDDTNGRADSLVVGTGNGENYLTAVLPSSATAPNPYEIWVADDGKKLAFSADKTADGYTTYVLNELEGDVVSTKYGFLPTDKSDATAYPFVVFDEEKNFIGAYGSLKEAASPAKNVVVGPENADKIVYVLLRRNYTFGENGTSDYYANYSQIGGTFILDLDDHVFSLTTTYLFNATKKTTSNVLHDSSMAVINGEIKLNSGYLVYPDHSASATEVKNFNFLFENIIFSFDSSSCSANPLMAVATGKGVGLIVNVDFVDCTFKFDKVLDKNVTLFNLEKATDTISVNVRIKGGKIISNAEAMAKITIAKLGTNDSVNFVRSDDGEFTTLLYPVGDTAPSMAFSTNEGERYYYHYDKNGDVLTYYLREIGNPDDNIYTKYGYIPKDYQSVDDYPFVVFDGEGNFLYAAPYLYGQTSADSAIGYAKNYVKSNVYDGSSYIEPMCTAIILMRKDWNLDTGYDGTKEYYSNIAQIQGTITIDLGGYTLYQRTTTYLIDGTMKSWNDGTGDATVFPSELEFKNGSIVSTKYALIGLTPKISGKEFKFRFENIDFSVEGATAYFASAQISTTYDVPAPTLEFVNCNIDITKATNKSLVLFHLGNGNVNPNILVSGCEIIADSTDYTIYSKDASGTGTLTLRESETNYNTLVLPVGISVPAGDGLEFIKVSETADFVTYKMSVLGKSNISFVPKASITLGAELVYNIYVPVVDYLKSFTIDGNTYENLVTVTLDDGNQYYHIPVTLGASVAARNVVLEATVTVGDKDYNGTWTMSIPKYAAKVIETSKSNEEITLVKDVLSYIRAAYAYFDTVDAEAIAKIDAILGKNYDANNAPTLNGSAEEPTTGLKSATYILNATPAIRFHITGEAGAYAFYVNGVKLKTKEGTDENGTYLEMDVYAYAMGETITYTINGVESGSYHINCYYTFVTTDAAYKDNAELINLVARFAKYCESAAVYRNSVLENS